MFVMSPLEKFWNSILFHTISLDYKNYNNQQNKLGNRENSNKARQKCKYRRASYDDTPGKRVCTDKIFFFQPYI